MEDEDKMDRYTERADRFTSEGWSLHSDTPNGPWEPIQVVYGENGFKAWSWRKPGSAWSGEPVTGYLRPGHDPEQPKLTLERAAMLGVCYSPYGYIICEDGTTYSLTRYATHGVIEAILFPELAMQQGYAPPVDPVDDNNVYLYQAFDLDNYRTLGVLRISVGSLTHSFTLSKAEKPATEPQKASLREVFQKHGIGRTDKVFAGYKEMTPAKVMQWLDQDERNAE